MDYTRRNLFGPSPLHEQHLQEVGIPLRFAPEAPKLKKTWVKKEGHGRFFQKTQECESAKMGAMQRVHVYYALATIMDRSTDTYCMHVRLEVYENGIYNICFCSGRRYDL